MPADVNSASRLMTAEDLAAELQIPVGTIYQWRYHGKGPAGLRVGRYVRYRRVDVDRWIEAQSALDSDRLA